jgi:hypothetical protein
LKGIEDKCWVQVQGCDPVRAIADEDLERENDEDLRGAFPAVRIDRLTWWLAQKARGNQHRHRSSNTTTKCDRCRTMRASRWLQILA